jgi:hypothetical protein
VGSSSSLRSARALSKKKSGELEKKIRDEKKMSVRFFMSMRVPEALSLAPFPPSSADA